MMCIFIQQLTNCVWVVQKLVWHPSKYRRKKPRLSGHACSATLDHLLESILAIRFGTAFLPALAGWHTSQPCSLISGACVVWGPLVRERRNVATLCVCKPRGERRGGICSISVRWPRAKPYFRMSFCPADCGEDDRGDLLFVAGYGAGGSSLPWREKGQGWAQVHQIC
jgi:hypothetical protein